MAVTCGLDFERRLTSPAFDVRRALSEALRELGFQIVVDQMTRIEARRGGMLGYGLMLKKQMPVQAVFDIAIEPPACAVVAHLTDNVKTIGKTWGINRQFHEIFDEICARVDAGLAGLDPAAAAGFEPARFWSRSGDVGILEQSTKLTTRAVGGALGVAGKAIDRPKDGTPRIWKGVDSVAFESSAGEAVLGLPDVQAFLGVAVLVASHPASMPPNLVRDVESFAAAVERRLGAADGNAATIEVPDAHKPVFEFLNQQAQIRAALPMRQLYICQTCRLEKIVNPEYKRIVARNEKLGDIVAGVTATVGKGGISPTFVLGQIFKVKRLDPDYVCSRCQGMEADERVVTYCPQCADLQRDVVLRQCLKCKFDFRTKASQRPIWKAVETVPAPDPALAASDPAASETEPAPVVPASEPAPVVPAREPEAPAADLAAPESPEQAPPPAPAAPPPPAPAAYPDPRAVPVGRPALGPGGGKICHSCGREHPSLWRVVVATPRGFEERFLCGETAACQMASHVMATQA